jgi:LacI family transcriptional regulator
MPATIKDIAKQVGLSITTVSRALNNYDDVSQETKLRVRQVADQLGYIPNTLAQRFQKSKSDTLGLVLPTFGPRFSDPYFSELLAGIGNKAASLGFDLLVSTCPPGQEEMKTYQRMVQGHRVDGLVVVRTRCVDERIQYLSSINFPFVAFGRVDGENNFPYVDEDGFYGMKLIADHLVELGHHRIACITPSPELMFTRHRIEGLKSRLQELGKSLDESLLRVGDLTQKGGYEQAGILLDQPNRPSAIVCCNDLMALGAMSASQEHGLVVGKDIAITGFDDIPLAEHAQPPLTTVNQPVYRIGNMVCEMLIDILQDKKPENIHVLLKPSLVVRQSSSKN